MSENLSGMDAGRKKGYEIGFPKIYFNQRIYKTRLNEKRRPTDNARVFFSTEPNTSESVRMETDILMKTPWPESASEG